MISNVKILKSEILSDNWYILKKITYEYSKKDGSVQTQTREAYDRGNGATILLYNRAQGTVILTRQFRLPTFINGNRDGMLIEACAKASLRFPVSSARTAGCSPLITVNTWSWNHCQAAWFSGRCRNSSWERRVTLASKRTPPSGFRIHSSWLPGK